MGFLRKAAPIVAFVLLAATLAPRAAARDFAPGEQVWCGACKGYVDAPHARCPNGADVSFCEECDAFLPPHEKHFGEQIAEAAEAAKPQAGPVDSALPADPAAQESSAPGWERALALLGAWWWVLPAAILPLVFLVSLAAGGRKSRAEAWMPMVDGVPQGLALVPGRLVCSENGKDDGGGTAIGYPAMVRLGRKWTPAFVKRMIGKGMRQEVRFPALRFEADILKRLKDTGAAPQLLVPPTETTLPDGQYWAYYAMSVAPGEPWPASGGLGGDTRRALYALCEALIRLHDLGIGHHDLKPQNLFWDARRRRVTLIDFGSAIDHTHALVNPLGATYPTTLPWVAPKSDGTCLSNLSLASDAWVYGLLFCEALVGGVHDPDRTKRRWPERPDDREWFFRELAEAESADLARAVVDGLFALQASRRMALSDFLDVLRKEWGF